MDPKKSGGQVENSFQAEKTGFGGFVFYQKITFGPIWGSGPKKRVQIGPLWSQRVPHWAQRVHMVAEGAHMGPWGPKGRKKPVFFLRGGPHLAKLIPNLQF